MPTEVLGANRDSPGFPWQRGRRSAPLYEKSKINGEGGHHIPTAAGRSGHHLRCAGPSTNLRR